MKVINLGATEKAKALRPGDEVRLYGESWKVITVGDEHEGSFCVLLGGWDVPLSGGAVGKEKE